MEPSGPCQRPGPLWVNTPVLLEALRRHEQQRLPRSLSLWLQGLLEIDPPASEPTAGTPLPPQAAP